MEPANVLPPGLNCLLYDRCVDGELAEGLPLPSSGVFLGAEEPGEEERGSLWV